MKEGANMKIVKQKWLKIMLWIAFLIPFSLWLYILLFVGTANSYIDNICHPLSAVLLVIIIIREIILDFNVYKRTKEDD